MKTKTKALLTAFLSAVMLAVTIATTATTANASSSEEMQAAAEDVQASASFGISDPEDCYFEVPTPDNCTVGMYYGSHKFGEVTWNDYYDDDHSRDVDNLYIGDRDGDGYYIRVCAVNEYTGQTVCDSDANGNADTISFSGNVPSGYSVDFMACIKKDGTTIACSGYDFWFDE